MSLGLPPSGVQVLELTQSMIDRAQRSLEEVCLTLTYAQSLDGKVAPAPGQQLRLSGETSMTLTHALRQVHDAILVGIGTVLSDDPRLNVRLVSGGRDPQPVILDSSLRCPVTCQLFTRAGGRRPMIFTRPLSRPEQLEKKKHMIQLGAQVIEVSMDDRSKRLDFGQILSTSLNI